MSRENNRFLVVNVLYWTVAALIHPIADALPTGSGQPPKFYSFLIPLFFVGLAFGSTTLLARAMKSAKDD